MATAHALMRALGHWGRLPERTAAFAKMETSSEDSKPRVSAQRLDGKGMAGSGRSGRSPACRGMAWIGSVADRAVRNLMQTTTFIRRPITAAETNNGTRTV